MKRAFTLGLAALITSCFTEVPDKTTLPEESPTKPIVYDECTQRAVLTLISDHPGYKLKEFYIGKERHQLETLMIDPEAESVKFNLRSASNLDPKLFEHSPGHKGPAANGIVIYTGKTTALVYTSTKLPDHNTARILVHSTDMYISPISLNIGDTLKTTLGEGENERGYEIEINANLEFVTRLLPPALNPAYALLQFSYFLL